MKLLARTLSILAIALLVVGATIAFSRTSYATTTFAQRGPDRARGEFSGGFTAQPGASPGTARDTFRNRGDVERGRRGGINLFGIVDIIKNLVLIAIIVMLIAPLVRQLQKRQARLSTQRRAPPNPTT